MDFKDFYIDAHFDPPLAPDDIRECGAVWRQMMRLRAVEFSVALNCTPAFTRDIQTILEQVVEKERESMDFIANLRMMPFSIKFLEAQRTDMAALLKEFLALCSDHIINIMYNYQEVAETAKAQEFCETWIKQLAALRSGAAR